MEGEIGRFFQGLPDKLERAETTLQKHARHASSPPPMNIPGLRLQVLADSVPWLATNVPGIAWYPLFVAEVAHDAARPRQASVLIRMDPGSSYPPHRHVGIEEVLLLQGGYRDDFGVHGAGSYVRYAAGSIHAPIATGDSGRPVGDDNPACIMFAVAHDGVENLVDRS